MAGVVPRGPIPTSMRNARYVRRVGVPTWAIMSRSTLVAMGGLQNLGDAGATEFEGMAASMHKTPQSLRLYVKRSEAQECRLRASADAWWIANDARGSRNKVWTPFGMGRQSRFRNGRRSAKFSNEIMALPTGVEPVFSD